MKPTVELLGYTMPLQEYRVIWDEDGSFAELMLPVDPRLSEPLDIIEYAGRVDYGTKSVNKMGDRDIIRRWIESGHESMLEMVDVVFQIECSRVVSHELVRHRIASYQQESQRYVKYEQTDWKELFYIPPELDPTQRILYEKALEDALEAYQRLLTLGAKSQIARYLLPNATATRIIAKMNLRNWRHFLLLRMHKSAQPEMQVVARAIWRELNDLFPEVFADIPDKVTEERAAR
jgi:thymidylate synthase (FAD)